MCCDIEGSCLEKKFGPCFSVGESIWKNVASTVLVAWRYFRSSQSIEEFASVQTACFDAPNDPLLRYNTGESLGSKHIPK